MKKKTKQEEERVEETEAGDEGGEKDNLLLCGTINVFNPVIIVF